MREISVLVGAAATALMASTAQGASTTSLAAECQRITPSGYVCALGRVIDDHTILVLDTTQQLPTDRPAVWASKAAENYRLVPGLDGYAGRLVMVGGIWTNDALFHARLLMVPAYHHPSH